MIGIVCGSVKAVRSSYGVTAQYFYCLVSYLLCTSATYYCSRQMAEEVLREGQGTGETGGDAATGFEGMETLARAIELGGCG